MTYDALLPFGAYRNSSHWKFNFKFLTKRKFIPGVIRGYFRRYPRDFISDVELDGVKFRCHPFQNCHDADFFSGSIFRLEAEEFAFLERHARDGGVFVDIGANTGAISVPLALKCPKLKSILAIEPDPVNISRLAYNTKINGISNIAISRHAIGDDNYASHLWINSPGNRGNNSLHLLGLSNKKRNKKQPAAVDVDVRLLADILNDNNIRNIDILKIDVEGYEDRALLPYFRASERSCWPKAVLIEHIHSENWKEDCIGWMKKNGYSVEFKNGANTMLVLN